MEATADASVLSVQWEEEITASEGKTFHQVVSQLVDLYRGSRDPCRGTALALTLETLCADEDGITHPLSDAVGIVLKKVVPGLDSFLQSGEIAIALAKAVRKHVPKPQWVEATSLALRRVAKDTAVTGSTRRAIDALVADGGLEAFVVSSLRRANRFLSCR